MRTGAIADFYLLEALLQHHPENMAQAAVLERAQALRDELTPQLARMCYDYATLICVGEARHGINNHYVQYIGADTPVELVGVNGNRSSAYRVALRYDPAQALPQLVHIFTSGAWSSGGSYGGPKWGTIAQAASMYGKVPDAALIDLVVSAEHNNGNCFSKHDVRYVADIVLTLQKAAMRQWMNHKAASQDLLAPNSEIEGYLYISDAVRRLISTYRKLWGVSAPAWAPDYVELAGAPTLERWSLDRSYTPIAWGTHRLGDPLPEEERQALRPHCVIDHVTISLGAATYGLHLSGQNVCQHCMTTATAQVVACCECGRYGRHAEMWNAQGEPWQVAHNNYAYCTECLARSRGACRHCGTVKFLQKWGLCQACLGKRIFGQCQYCHRTIFLEKIAHSEHIMAHQLVCPECEPRHLTEHSLCGHCLKQFPYRELWVRKAADGPYSGPAYGNSRSEALFCQPCLDNLTPCADCGNVLGVQDWLATNEQLCQVCANNSAKCAGCGQRVPRTGLKLGNRCSACYEQQKDDLCHNCGSYVGAEHIRVSRDVRYCEACYVQWAPVCYLCGHETSRLTPVRVGEDTFRLCTRCCSARGVWACGTCGEATVGQPHLGKRRYYYAAPGDHNGQWMCKRCVATVGSVDPATANGIYCAGRGGHLLKTSEPLTFFKVRRPRYPAASIVCADCANNMLKLPGVKLLAQIGELNPVAAVAP